MIGSRGISLAALLVALSMSAAGEELFSQSVRIVPDKIAYIPPLAKAVLSGDAKEVISAIKAGDNVDAKVEAKDGGRAGFTLLILAATLPNPNIAQLLVGKHAKVTILDDFNRSAFWYAALRGSVATTQVLMSAPDGEDIINVADNDMNRTPLHLAVRS